MGLIGGSGYHLEPEAFEQLTKGIQAATAELKELGFDMEAQLGRGFDKLSLDSVECGDDALAAVLDSFCDRWGWGVRGLMQNANEFSQKLGITAGFYYEQEQYASDALKQTANAAWGDPNLSAEELHKRSWGKVANPLSQFDDADWDPNSQKSRESYGEVAEATHQFGHDVTSIPDRLMNGGEDPSETTAKLEPNTPSQAHKGEQK
jgi:hypothetical protein